MELRLSPALLAVALCCAFGTTAADRAVDLDVVDEGHLHETWMLADGSKAVAPGYPRKFADSGREVCMAFGYRIEPDGSTADYRVLAQWNSLTGGAEPQRGFWSAFEQSAAQAVSQWKFQPREGVAAEPTYTVATLGWQSGGAGDPTKVRARCKVGDLAALLRGDRRTGLNDHLIDRDNRAANRWTSTYAGTPKGEILPPPQVTGGSNGVTTQPSQAEGSR